MDNDSNQMPPVVSASSSAPVSSPSVAPAIKKHNSGDSSLLKVVIIILLTLLLIGALLLAFYFYTLYTSASSDLDSKIEAAVLEANKEQENLLRAEFDEQEKKPYKTFTGPADYGSLSFQYPKTWSVYIDKDASNGGNFEAYLHPLEIAPINDNQSRFALEVYITNDTFENAASYYAQKIKDGALKSSVIQINGQDAARYDGELPNGFLGSVVIIKIRDKIAYLQTDAEIYEEDFNKIIETVTFNQ